MSEKSAEVKELEDVIKRMQYHLEKVKKERDHFRLQMENLKSQLEHI